MVWKTVKTRYGSESVYVGGNRLRLGWWRVMKPMDAPVHLSVKKRESITGEAWLYFMFRIFRLQIDWKVWRAE